MKQDESYYQCISKDYFICLLETGAKESNNSEIFINILANKKANIMSYSLYTFKTSKIWCLNEVSRPRFIGLSVSMAIVTKWTKFTNEINVPSYLSSSSLEPPLMKSH